MSRTQRKREALDLQSIGARLVGLEPGDLARIPIPDQLADAIQACRRIRSHEARRRQLQFIGKLMRRLDTAPIREALARLDGDSAGARHEFHQIERWRERLIDDDGALTEYLDDHPDVDRQALRRLIARVRKAADDSRRKSESRALFRFLREADDAG
ncbi:MAG TPA: ribosome biogenesis factor YjgA [Pseudomonadales bacterium]